MMDNPIHPACNPELYLDLDEQTTVGYVEQQADWSCLTHNLRTNATVPALLHETPVQANPGRTPAERRYLNSHSR